MKITNDFIFFWGDNDPFSNFHPAKVTFPAGFLIGSLSIFGEISVPTSEHAFMYAKALFFDDIRSASLIREAKTPLEAKKLGRGVTHFNPIIWDYVSKDIMYEVNKLKYMQNKALLHILMSTRGKELVEASPMDKIWGIGLAEDDYKAVNKANWKGENRLGVVLTELREELYATCGYE